LPARQKERSGAGRFLILERKVTTVRVYDYKQGNDYHAATNHYAGLLCGCGDYSCPAMSDDTKACFSQDLD
jgi:hypothetical protein